MKNQLYIKIVVLFVSLSEISTAHSQSIKNVRINEIQVHNTTGLHDEYGQFGGWIELHNTGYGKVNIGGCYLEVKGKKYRIPKGDPKTIIPKQGYCVFFAADTPNKGTFHTNLTLDSTDYIKFYDVDGKLIDTFRFNPAEMKKNVSYGWFENRKGKEVLLNLPATTPGGSNNTEEQISRGEEFRMADPTGIVLTVIAIVAVAISLTALYLIFKYMGRFYVNSSRKKAEKTMTRQGLGGIKINVKDKSAVTNDELAAMAIALYKYAEDLHDIENTVLTINRAAKFYSPWSSKIYGLTQIPNKK